MKHINDRGFSMIELMIAIIAGAALSLGVAQYVMNMNKMLKSGNQRADVNQAISLIMQEIADNASCSATVYGAHPTTNTIISSIKRVDARGQIASHPQLVVRPLGTTKTSKPTITGMYIKHISDHGTGGSYELRVTFTNNNNSRNTSTAGNVVTEIIPLQLDNCQRFMVAAPQNDPATCAIDAPMLCRQAGGRPIGKPVRITGVEAAPNIFVFQGCQICTLPRTTIKGCLSSI